MGLISSCGKDAAAPVTSVRPPATTPAADGCDWPMYGQRIERPFSYPCPTRLAPETVKDLGQDWFFNTHDVVTATPAVVDGTVYVGDWSAKFYALDATTGQPRWTYQAEVVPNVYAGQIVSSAAVADVGGVRTVFFGSGRTMHALRADNGQVRWARAFGTGTAEDHTEIESSPAVHDGKVFFGTDVHNHVGQKAGVYALDAATGDQVWYWDPDEGGAGSGCVDVWGSPSIDATRGALFVGTGSCDRGVDHWTRYTESIVSLETASGRIRWVHQPHQPSTDDLDFAGAPNLFEASGRPVVGLGSKDGIYYALDRDSGTVVWKTRASGPSATGGFIGPTSYARGIVAGGTAVGPGPFLHGIDAADGRLLWQNRSTEATYAAAAEANGVLFLGGNDFTFRAVDLKTGDVRWSTQTSAAVSGGAAVVGDSVFAVAGIREPGLDKRSQNSGVYRFSLLRPGNTRPAAPATTAAPGTTAPPVGNLKLTNTDQPCVNSPCPLRFDLKPVPAGAEPRGTLEIRSDPFSLTIDVAGLGPPAAWLAPGTPAADAGASLYGVYVSESDDNPVGGLVCVIDTPPEAAGSGSCTGTTLPRLAPYNRVTLLALKDRTTAPTVADGLGRLVTTMAMKPPLDPTPA